MIDPILGLELDPPVSGVFSFVEHLRMLLRASSENTTLRPGLLPPHARQFFRTWSTEHFNILAVCVVSNDFIVAVYVR